MFKMVLGVIVGFVAWSILWVGSDQVLILASPNWYGAHQQSIEIAMVNGEPFSPDQTILLLSLARGIIISVMSGFLAAFIAGENKRTPLILGVMLLVVGILVEAMAWNYLPIWYHIVFLLMIIPATLFGGKLKQTA